MMLFPSCGMSFARGLWGRPKCNDHPGAKSRQKADAASARTFSCNTIPGRRMGKTGRGVMREFRNAARCGKSVGGWM